MAYVERPRRPSAHVRFPNTIAAARTAHGDAQVELAAALGVPRAYVAFWEAGTSLPIPEHLKKMRERYREAVYPKWVAEAITRAAEETA